MTPRRHALPARAAALLLALLAAAGCGSRRPADAAAAAEPEPPEAALCRAEARDSPEVRRLARELNVDNQQNVLRVGEERRLAEIRAFRDCMRRRGLAMPGGVEPVRRSF
ncbi:phosphoribosylamine--glycine ligase [Caldovatus aquaticus]|uniref:Phosphoribosylamine--glycine ligase n=1 Tax=Caldovatus aquaticus TaxID=2865671 RepID=A0ABS7F3N1_9PROT|nr:phosphoribosylamine--glycine ligase [Caldovatus aquaticus]MBW8270212.1 phosphoribosylamine--glycine ligase [Caldovatus aquaticus]